MFPSLILQPGGKNHSANTGVPTNGVNTFLHNIPDCDPNWLRIIVKALGSSITDATVSSATETSISINFTQSGIDQAFIEAEHIHTTPR